MTADLNVLSLFAGVDGFGLGLERAGIRIVGQVELDPFCRTILARHFPEVPRHDDVRTAAEWWRGAVRPRVHIVAGGFPCQPFSTAGLQLGIADERWGWPWMRDFVAAVRPRYVLIENVVGLLRNTQAFYRPQWRVDAPELGAAGSDARGHGWLPEPDVGRVAHGVPKRLVAPENHALGNAVVPAVGEARWPADRRAPSGWVGCGMTPNPRSTKEFDVTRPPEEGTTPTPAYDREAWRDHLALHMSQADDSGPGPTPILMLVDSVMPFFDKLIAERDEWKQAAEAEADEVDELNSRRGKTQAPGPSVQRDVPGLTSDPHLGGTGSDASVPVGSLPQGEEQPAPTLAEFADRVEDARDIVFLDGVEAKDQLWKIAEDLRAARGLLATATPLAEMDDYLGQLAQKTVVRAKAALGPLYDTATISHSVGKLAEFAVWELVAFRKRLPHTVGTDTDGEPGDCLDDCPACAVADEVPARRQGRDWEYPGLPPAVPSLTEKESQD